MTARAYSDSQRESAGAVREIKKEIEKREKEIHRALAEIRMLNSAVDVLEGREEREVVTGRHFERVPDSERAHSGSEEHIPDRRSGNLLPRREGVFSPWERSRHSGTGRQSVYQIGKKTMVPIKETDTSKTSYKPRTKRFKSEHGKFISVAHREALSKGLVRTRYSWTDEEVETLRRLVDRGYNNRVIAEKMKRPVGGIQHRRRVLGIPSRPASVGRSPTMGSLSYYPKRIVKAHSDRRSGKKTFVRGKRPWAKGDDEKLKQLVREGYINSEIVPVLNRSVRAVQQRRLKLGMASSPALVGRTPTNVKGKSKQQKERPGFFVFERLLPISKPKKVKKYRPYRKYSRHEDKMIAGMRRNGYTQSQIATRLRRNPGSIASRVKMLEEKNQL